MNIVKFITKKQYLLFFGSILFCVTIFSAVKPSIVSASYNGGRLVDDSVFLDARSMSSSQIQSLLNSLNSGLKSRSYKLNCNDAATTQAYNSVGASCSANYSAANVIYFASQIYGVSPRVILATMQKEQGLVTATSPTSWQLNQAMGYACPTSGSCSSSSNFAWQVDVGTWSLRAHYEQANGNNDWWLHFDSWVCGTKKTYYKPNLYPRQNVNFYDGNGVLYRTHYISNPATSALYCYTPHAYNNPHGLYGLPKYGSKGTYYSGSYNFVYWYEKWFGSTEGTPFFELNNRIYITGADNTYYYVPDPATLRDYGYGSTTRKVQKVNSSYISGMTNAGSLPLIARFEGNPIYAISGAKRHYFSSPSLFNNYGFSFGNEAKLPSWATQYIPGGADMQSMLSDGTSVFSVESGKIRPICSTSAYSTLGSPIYSSRPKIDLNSNFSSTLSWGAPIASPGTLIKSTSGSYGVWNGTSLQPFNSTAAKDLAVSACGTSGSGFSLLPTSGVSFNKLVKNSSGKLYILDKQVKLSVKSSDLSAFGLSSNDFISVNDSFLNALGTKDISRLIRVDSGKHIYYIANGKMHYVPSRSILYGLGYDFGDVINVSDGTSKLLQTGGPALNQGLLVRIGKSNPVYLIGNDFEKKYVPSPSIMYDYGYSFRSVVSVSASSLTEYPTTGTLDNIARDPSGNYWLMSQKHKHRIPQTLLSSSYYDLNAANTQMLSSKTLGYLPNGRVISEVFRSDDNSRVYIIDHGQKRYVTSPTALYNSGHTFSDVVSLSPGFVNSLGNGPSYN